MIARGHLTPRPDLTLGLLLLLGVVLGPARPAIAQPADARSTVLPGPVTLVEPAAAWRWQI
nr:hypothetical protein [Myxococcota bacterium]